MTHRQMRMLKRAVKQAVNALMALWVVLDDIEEEQRKEE